MSSNKFLEVYYISNENLESTFLKMRLHTLLYKYILLKVTPSEEIKQLVDFTKIIKQTFLGKNYKKRFTIHKNQSFYFIDTHNISIFMAQDGVIFALDLTGKKHILNEVTLKDIEQQVDPSEFFRINRSEIINKQQVEKVERYSKNALFIKIKGQALSLKTSQSTTTLFKNWLEI